jgi:hypothetical protein
MKDVCRTWVRMRAEVEAGMNQYAAEKNNKQQQEYQQQ